MAGSGNLVKIRYSGINQSANMAQDIADRMRDMANDIGSRIVNPANSLPGESSGCIYNVIRMANEKARQLRERADCYESIHYQLLYFGQSARQHDQRVQRRISKITRKEEKNLTWYQKIQYGIYKFFNGIFGGTELGKFISNVINIHRSWQDTRRRIISQTFQWFKYGDGKYVLKIAIAFAAIAGAVSGAILAFPVSGVIATIVAVATVIGAVVTLYDSVATIISSTNALLESGTEPGIANWHGRVNDAASFAKTYTTDATTQRAWQVFDYVGDVANAVAFAGSFLTTTTTAGTHVDTFDKGTILENLGKKFGMKYDKGLHFYSGGIFGIKNPENLANGSLFQAAWEMQQIAKPVENIGKLFQTGINFNGGFNLDTLKSIGTGSSSLFPGLKGYNVIIKHVVAFAS